MVFFEWTQSNGKPRVGFKTHISNRTHQFSTQICSLVIDWSVLFQGQSPPDLRGTAASGARAAGRQTPLSLSSDAARRIGALDWSGSQTTRNMFSIMSPEKKYATLKRYHLKKNKTLCFANSGHFPKSYPASARNWGSTGCCPEEKPRALGHAAASRPPKTVGLQKLGRWDVRFKIWQYLAI